MQDLSGEIYDQHARSQTGFVGGYEGHRYISSPYGRIDPFNPDATIIKLRHGEHGVTHADRNIQNWTLIAKRSGDRVHLVMLQGGAGVFFTGQLGDRFQLGGFMMAVPLDSALQILELRRFNKQVVAQRIFGEIGLGAKQLKSLGNRESAENQLSFRDQYGRFFKLSVGKSKIAGRDQPDQLVLHWVPAAGESLEYAGYRGHPYEASYAGDLYLLNSLFYDSLEHEAASGALSDKLLASFKIAYAKEREHDGRNHRDGDPVAALHDMANMGLC
ncbi:MAG: hypothetical protein H7A33_06060 [Deltaproteobacteria bacterium]|nr:hypothetical protein [Deltaproteobacteria bacterium]